MKTHAYLLPIGLLLLLSTVAPLELRAQQASGTPSMTAPPPPLPPQGGAQAPGAPPRNPLVNLTDAEKAQMKAAHDKAIQQDPSLEQRMKEARQAMDAAKKSLHDAMIRADPSVEPILAKMAPPPKPPAGGGAAPGSVPTPPVPPLSGGTPTPALSPQPPLPPQTTQASHPPAPWHPSVPGLTNLTEAERVRLKALHEQVRNDPAVVSAKSALDVAAPEARASAEKALHEARRNAMIKADPSVESLLTKLHPEASPTPSPTASPKP